MAVVQRKLRGGRVVYWVKFVHLGKDVWERSGSDKRAAKALDAQRKREVAAGTYRPGSSSATTVKTWFERWLAGRTNRTVENDRALVERHVLGRDWFNALPLRDAHRRHVLQLVEEMRREKRLGEKSIATVIGVVLACLRRAEFEGLAFDKFDLPRGTLTRKTAPGNRRKPYQRDEVSKILGHGYQRPDVRVFLALLFYTGMREGEVCGRRWRDLDRSPSPLAALSVHSQYDDQPLKGDDRDITRPRMVPVHPELQEILEAWRTDGFELVHCRKPTPEDFIVPQSDGTNHTKSSGYKLFQRALVAAGVANRSLHSTRHTFVSIARSNGARPDVLERVTHNASGETIDDYTTFEWRALCEAVARVDFDVDPIANRAVFGLQSLDSKQADKTGNVGVSTGIDGKERPPGDPRFSRETPLDDAWFDARHRRLLKLSEVDPEAARPGLAVCEGLQSALAGDEATTLATLAEAARSA